LFGGIFLDTIGMKWGILLFSTLLVIGQLIFMAGGYLETYWIMLLGRVVFGLGGESLSVSQSAIVSKWFKGKELAFALAVNISVSRLGSVINGWVVPPVYES
jgi:MFS family permease